MQDDINLPDPDDAAAHMFPSDLAKFKKTEKARYAYPVPVSTPKERSIPLYTADQVRAAVRADREGRQQEQLVAAAKRMTKLYPHVWDRSDGALVVFPENVERFDAAFDGLRIALGEAVEDPDFPLASAQRAKGD